MNYILTIYSNGVISINNYKTKLFMNANLLSFVFICTVASTGFWFLTTI